MPVFWLDPEHIIFPDPIHSTPDGLLAAGGDLSKERLLLAYRNGIFPWYAPGDPILWWCPDPRCVLFPEDLKVSKSMRPYFNQRKFEVTYDRCFTEVMLACAQQPRNGQAGTWITREMMKGYTRLHEAGFAHSVEVWKEKELVGGLYGIAIGKVFFGESMFARASNASKFGFISLVHRLEAQGFTLIDCQQETGHLLSLGATTIPRPEFLQALRANDAHPDGEGKWG
ncbi:leucyl/phenylalanyl-tRNA--protein transferase [Phaeodactylibacter xiamenensis]|uniref:leucyl/phenylalanyl-tRNA--protein transferase n=1 Tax=Phaeodactylibacter xiamenensis TaxID=1524460 RepID=UPI003BA9EC1B